MKLSNNFKLEIGDKAKGTLKEVRNGIFLFAFVFSLTLLFIQAFFHQADVQNQNRERHIQNIRLKVDLQTVGNTAPQLDNETKKSVDRIKANREKVNNKESNKP